jgi:hypothetical protein
MEHFLQAVGWVESNSEPLVSQESLQWLAPFLLTKLSFDTGDIPDNKYPPTDIFGGLAIMFLLF